MGRLMEEWQGGYTVVAGRRRMRRLSEGQPIRGTLRRPASEARLSQRQVEEEQAVECLTWSTRSGRKSHNGGSRFNGEGEPAWACSETGRGQAAPCGTVA